jgi:4-alpha-glucanotransferase
MRPRPLLGRAAGLVAPLFSLHSTTSWGIGDLADLPRVAPWLRQAGLQGLQLLPVSTLPAGQRSPYSALSAMAIDPIYVSLPDVREFQALGGEARLPLADQIALKNARAAATVQYDAVRQLKEDALRLAFNLFWEVDWIRTTARAGAFAAYASFEEWWLADYALYSALRQRFEGASWQEWPEPIRERQPAALDAARQELEQEILFHQYVQWQADQQWEHAREQLRDVRLFGDFPFMVACDSADVWARQHLFRFDACVGTPPDAFSDSGQDWGLPVYRWDVMAAEDFRWLRERARRMCRLYDGYRVDHLVGFFRTYSRPLGGTIGSFDPAEEEDQIRLGERLLALFQEGGAQITAEDLGLIPDFVRESLQRMEIAGYKVLRWERAWKAEGQPFLDPREYPACSVVTTSTHDIEPIALWWETASAEERELFRTLLAEKAIAIDDLATERFSDALRDAILALAYHARSELLLLPVQDAFGWPDRINVPATTGDENWTWRMPIAVDALEADDEASACAQRLRKLAEESGRIQES